MQKNPPHYIHEFDGLRAIAVLMVMVWHYLLGQSTAEMLPKYLWLGLSWSWSGVDMFFVLSGFLIGRILLHYKGSGSYFKTFYIRRFFRIFPAYYLLLGTYIVAAAVGLAQQFPILFSNAIPNFAYALFIQNYFMGTGFGANWLAITWSLSVEEQFYLVFPLLVHKLPIKKLPSLLIIGILLAPILRGIIGGYAAYIWLPTRMDALLVGVLIAYYYQNGQLTRWLAGYERLLSTITLLVFGILMVLVFEGSAKNTGAILNHSLYAVLYGLVIINILINKNYLLNKLLRNAVLRFVGKISYSIYLFHQLFLLILYKLLLQQDVPWLYGYQEVLVTLLSFVCTLAFSALLYFVLEKPLQNIGKRFQYQ